jgi:hypothetical protein
MENRLIFLYHRVIDIPSGMRVIGGTQKGRSSICWIRWFKPVGWKNRQIRSFIQKPRGDEDPACGNKLIDPILPRKASSEIIR